MQHVTDTLICATAGSVDDGKSTLIGRLLLDSRSLLRDQLSHIEEASLRRGFSRTELALVTDGLRAEREQGITIDAAWRYFATPKRRFVLADTPGHVQYTRNMITGASQADVAIVLMDAERGLTEQTRRHLAITALLRVPLVFAVVNKMDRVGFRKDRFDELVGQAEQHLAQLPWATTVKYLPVCALDGDNVVDRSTRMPWYDGPALLEELETAEPAPVELGAGVLSVQWVIRPQREDYATFRGLAGRITSGQLTVGDEVVVAPAMIKSRITRIDRHVGDGAVPSTEQSASRGASVIVSLADDVDASRGSYLVSGTELPPELTLRRRITVEVCWMNSSPAVRGQKLWVKHQSRRVVAQIAAVTHRLDVVSGKAEVADTLAKNDLGTLELVLGDEIPATAYVVDRALGSVLLVDPTDGDTVGAGMIVDP
ncbi:MAG: 50S ribosome-binding GTPase [Deltaproteobacteria bacterium]|nr:50S ribosome-binding GTPase [Deltaproteobacteria bacterium]